MKPEKLRVVVDNAKPADDAEMQRPFKVVRRGTLKELAGLYREVERTGEDKKTTKTWVRFCSPIEILATTRNSTSQAWGRILSITDPSGVIHSYVMPMETLAGTSVEMQRELLHRGLLLMPGRQPREWLEAFVMSWVPTRTVRCVDHLGWHGQAFVLPDKTYGDGAEETIAQIQGTAPVFHTKGTLEGWQREVAAPAVGNLRLLFGIAAAFAGPVLYLVNEPSGGFNFKGASSGGKSTTLACTASVWGTPVHTWRATANGLETTAAGATDTLLVLDELGQMESRDADALAYMLANQTGKTRMRKEGGARTTATWRVLFLSSGEIGLADKIAEAGKRAKAGQLVRVADIPADAGAGKGMFENIHDATSASAFADALRIASDTHVGHAGRAFLEQITATDPVEFAAGINAVRAKWLGTYAPKGCDGQVSRVASRFALIAAAGEMAIGVGLLPWPHMAAYEAAGACFRSWLADRGGAGAHELTAGLAQVHSFIEAHGMSRFEPAWAAEEERAAFEKRAALDPHERGFGSPLRLAERVTINRAGFRRMEDGLWSYYVLPEAWRNEVTKGFDAKMLSRAMIDRGWMAAGDGKNHAKKAPVPGYGKSRYFTILPSFNGLEDVDGTIASGGSGP